MIEAKDLFVSIKGRKILEGESLTCKAGQLTAIIGPSGSGKTTLLHCLGLLLPIDQGSIYINGKDYTRASQGKRRKFFRNHAGFILQDYGIIHEESVAYNVTLCSKLFTKKGRKGDKNLESALEMTGLSGREEEFAGHLSGGEKQRLALARAIYKQADILLVDEPTASLDPDHRQIVIQLLLDYAKLGRMVVVATHDAEVIQAATSIYEINNFYKRKGNFND